MNIVLFIYREILLVNSQDFERETDVQEARYHEWPFQTPGT